MTKARLPLICCLLLSGAASHAASAAGQCTEPARPLGTSFACTTELPTILSRARQYLSDRSKGATVTEQKTRLVTRTKEETVLVYWEEKDGKVKLRVEVQPGGKMPLLSESATAARELRNFLNSGLH